MQYVSQLTDRDHPRTDIEMQKFSQFNYPPPPLIISEGPLSNRNLKVEKEKLSFEGFSFEFELFLREKRRDELLRVSEAEIVLQGMEVKSINKCVPFCCGFLFAYLYCLCNCIFCCNCRQKVIYTLYEVHQLGYENVLRLVQSCPNLIIIKMRVRDNYLNEAKAIVLEKALSLGNVKRFELINEALGISIEPDKNFENFAFHFKRLKQLRIETTIRWEDTVVT